MPLPGLSVPWQCLPPLLRTPQASGRKLCGLILPSPTHRWWLLLWGVLQAGPAQGSVLLAQQLPQQLTFPGFPEPYLKGQESTTVIEAPEGFAVKLMLQDFDLELSQDCEPDSVTVSWGPRGTPGWQPPGLEPGANGRWQGPGSGKMDEEPKSGAQAGFPGRRGSAQVCSLHQQPCPWPCYHLGPKGTHEYCQSLE